MGTGFSTLNGGAETDTPEYLVELQFKCELEIDSVIRTAEAAGAAVMQIYKEESKWEVEIKADHSPLTRADREANHIICEDLLRMTPHVPIVSEENKKLPYEYRNNFQYFWLIDPLDGTKEFLKRNGEFTVNIALIQGGVPVLGVVHVPVTGKTYWAVKGKGAWLKEGDSQKRIKCAEFNLDDPGLTIVASSSHGSKETNEFISVFDKPKLVQVGSSLKLLMVAEGAAHMYPRMAPTSEWDTAAADIIVREAGGACVRAGACDSQGNALEDWKEAALKEQPLVYNKESFLNPFFIVFGTRKAPE